MAVGLLQNLTSSDDQPEPEVTLYLLGDILNGYNSSDDQDLFIEVGLIIIGVLMTHEIILMQSFLDIGENLIAEEQEEVKIQCSP